MRNSIQNPDFYKLNRAKLAEKLPKNVLAVVNSNYQMPTNADGTFPYVQNSDLFYLTGIDQEDTTLILFRGQDQDTTKEILFIRYADELILTWEGHKHSREDARKLSGIETVFWQTEFEKVLKNLIFDCDTVYINSNEHRRADILVQSKDDQFLRWCRKNFPLHHYKRLAPLLLQLRTIKQEHEILQVKKACEITKAGFERVAGFLKPGIWEYEMEAEFSHEFLKRGSKGFAYQPIIASGNDTCVLHYISNNKQCSDGDLVLLDVAAEYNNYKSDLTRVLPVSGKFTARQKEVYNAVVRMLKYAVTLLRPGTDFEDYNRLVGAKAHEELINLGVLPKSTMSEPNEGPPAYKKYFMHGVSHFLGLDVHDVGVMKGKMKPGMLLTCEPGIYLKNESIGIRLENNILITEDGNLDLMKDIPLEADDIEDLMQNMSGRYKKI